jgi:hypothetical protein
MPSVGGDGEEEESLPGARDAAYVEDVRVVRSEG